MKTLFDEQVYRLGNYLYRAVRINGDRVAFESRRLNDKQWYRGNCYLNEWNRDVTDVGEVYEDAV